MLILLPWLLLLADARAEVFTYSTNFMSESTVLLPRFDPSVGSLSEATLGVRALFVGGYTFYNSSDQPMQISEPFTAYATFSSVTPPCGGTSGGSGLLSGTVPPYSSAYLSAMTGGDWASMTTTPAGDLASYTGTDPFGLDILCTAISPSIGYLPGSFYCEVDLTYTYVVPEPSAVTLLGFALSAVALLARRKDQTPNKR